MDQAGERWGEGGAGGPARDGQGGAGVHEQSVGAEPPAVGRGRLSDHGAAEGERRRALPL